MQCRGWLPYYPFQVLEYEDGKRWDVYCRRETNLLASLASL